MNFTLCFFYKQDIFALIKDIMRLSLHKTPEQIDETLTEEPTIKEESIIPKSI